jgi:two-component system sensor histidine kinase EvgS
MSVYYRILALIILLSSAAFVSAKHHRHIVVGFNNQFPPYEYLNTKHHIEGSNVDIIKALGKDAGYRFSFVSNDWNIIRQEFDAGKIQILAGFIKTPEREKKYLFTNPHSYVHYSVFIRIGSQPLLDWKDLAGKQILLESGNVVEEIIKSKGISVIPLYESNFQEALEKLSIGTGDVVVMPKIQGYHYIAKYRLDNLMEVQSLGEAMPYCIALPLGYEDVRDNLNKSLARLTSNYQLRDSQSKWFGAFETKVSVLDVHSKYYKLILFVLIVGLFIIALLIHYLGKRIKQQKKYLALQILERSNYEKEFNLRHQLFVTGPIIFLKWNDVKREMFDSISNNFAMFGYDSNDILNGKIQYRSIIHPEDLEWILRQRQQHLDNHEHSYYQIYRIICPPQSDDANNSVVNLWHDRNVALANVNTVQIRWVFDYTVIMPDDISNTIHFYGFLLDITKQKVYEAELLKQHQEAHTAINTKDIFLTSISAEINSPLNALIGLARKISDKNLDEEQVSSLQVITDSAKHLKLILQQIHDFLNILKGSIGSVPKWFVLRRLIEPIVTEFQIRIAGKGITFEHSEYQPTALVFLDSDWFQKVVRIVLDNAVKFTQEGKIVLTVDLIQKSPTSGELVVRISDTGVGIPEDKVHMIMEPFTQADETFTRRFGGIGLGLSIARNLLIQMNGIIRITNNEPKGTIVELIFPVDIQ